MRLRCIPLFATKQTRQIACQEAYNASVAASQASEYALTAAQQAAMSVLLAQFIREQANAQANSQNKLRQAQVVHLRFPETGNHTRSRTS